MQRYFLLQTLPQTLLQSCSTIYIAEVSDNVTTILAPNLLNLNQWHHLDDYLTLDVSVGAEYFDNLVIIVKYFYKNVQNVTPT